MYRDCYVCDSKNTVSFGGQESFSNVYPDGDTEAFELCLSYRCCKCGAVYEVLTSKENEDE